jgi:peptidoglycan/xylan/chitin deacetylase (PgdA/CDA1 family)
MVKVRWWMKWLYPGVVWNFSRREKVLYLTFDDGPIPDVTPKVLDILARYNAPATFFSIGDNVRKHPDIFRQIQTAGHRIGNHSFHHYNSWKVTATDYIHDVEFATSVIDSDLFRPPYGKLTPRTLWYLRKKFRIVMWDVISCDFDTKVSAEQVYQNVIENAGPGSVVVFHDSLKAAPSMLVALPKVLDYFKKEGYVFRIIP